MNQNRLPPAYMEYAANMLADANFRILTLSERGLLYTIRLECWVNRELPANPDRLARVLGQTETEIRKALPNLTPFFSLCKESMLSPELEHYRAYLDDRRMRQSRGGAKGAATSNSRYRAKPSDAPAPKPQLTCNSLVQINPVQSSQNQSLEGDIASHTEWLGDYERESNGG